MNRNVLIHLWLITEFENVKNYIAIVGNKNDQEKAGYYGEKIVLKCQKLA